MTQIFQKLIFAELKIAGVDLPRILNRLSDEEYRLERIYYIDELEIKLLTYYKDLPKITTLVNKMGGEVKIIGNPYFIDVFQRLKNHVILLFTALTMLFLFAFLPTRVLFLSVSGNKSVSSSEIIALSNRQGLYPGAKRKNVRSEQIKNVLINQYPTIKWAGVNTRGAEATILIEENIIHAAAGQAYPCDIVSSSDGVIQRIEVKEGTVYCREGDMVKSGDVLISGKQDVAFCTLSKEAAGEVYAFTLKNVSVISPKTECLITANRRVKHRLSLRYQNFRIKLPFSSGIPDTFCGRISEDYCLVLPGGFRLPFFLQIDSYIPYIYANSTVDESDAERILLNSARTYILDSMVAGIIKTENTQFSGNDLYYRMDGLFHCCEMIGRTKAHEIGDVYGKNN